MNTEKTLLVIDDNKINISLLLELLQDKYKVIPALSGKQALKIVQTKDVDLILLDIKMPVMNGFEVCEKLKEDVKTQNIPVIFITANTDEDSIEKAYDVGGIDYITKPFRPREVQSRITTHLALSNQKQILEKMLFQQSKLASIGEMVDSVAHQWKQPLHIINLMASSIQSDFNNKSINDKYIEDFKNQILRQIKHMHITLDEFRNFFRPNQDTKHFDIQSMLDKVMILVQDEFIKENITIEINAIDNFVLIGVENEFQHLVLNIINNSKDAFIENNIQNRQIIINILDEKIEFIDNASGICDEVIDNIFEANFTTKAQGKGTGIGLYLSSQIASKFNGKLSVENVDDGVKFIFKI